MYENLKTDKKLKILFRKKLSSRFSLKVFINIRIKGRRTPKQIHICYIGINTDTIREGDKNKIKRKINEILGFEANIDWDNAQDKFNNILRDINSRPSC